MHPLLWLSLPVIVTVVAAVVLYRRDARSMRDDSDQNLRRITRSLGPRP